MLIVAVRVCLLLGFVSCVCVFVCFDWFDCCWLFRLLFDFGCGWFVAFVVACFYLFFIVVIVIVVCLWLCLIGLIVFVCV